MNKKEEKHIKNLMSKIEANKAPNDFTNKVMKDVFMMSAGEEALKSAALTSLLKRTVTENVQHDFTEAVMSKIEAQKDLAYKPLIGKKAWFLISSAVIAVLVLVIMNDTPKESNSIFDSILPYMEQTKVIFINPLKNISISPLFTISFLSLSSMLIFDALLKRKLLA